MILISVQRPFKEMHRNRMELFDEGFIIFFMYHIFCFTDFVPEQATKNIVGYSAITCMLAHMLYFYILLAYFYVRKKTKSCRRRYALKKAKKQAAL